MSRAPESMRPGAPAAGPSPRADGPLPSTLFVMSLPPPHHGANTVNEVVWSAMAAEGGSMRLVDLSDRRDLRNLGRLDLRNVQLGLRHLVELVIALRRHRPALVYLLLSQNAVAYLRDGLFIVVARVIGRSRVLVHLHGGYFADFHAQSGRLLRAFIDRTLRLASAGIVYSTRLRHHLAPWVAEIHAIPNPAAIGRHFDTARKAAQRDRTAPLRITYLSNLVRSKGILSLLDGLRRLAERGVPFSCRVAGGWAADPLDGSSPDDLEAEVRARLTESSLSGRVALLGPVAGPAKEALLAETDVFVLPTTYPYEGHPVSIIEAMAFGCVVISTDRGAIAETVLDGETGFIVPERDGGAIADCLASLDQDRDRLDRLAAAARVRYEQEYTVERFLERLRVALRQTASPEGPAGPR